MNWIGKSLTKCEASSPQTLHVMAVDVSDQFVCIYSAVHYNQIFAGLFNLWFMMSVDDVGK